MMYRIETNIEKENLYFKVFSTLYAVENMYIHIYVLELIQGLAIKLHIQLQVQFSSLNCHPVNELTKIGHFAISR